MTQRLKITKRAVDGLKATGVRHVAWDTEVSGFGVRVAPSGGKTYILRYRAGGGRAGRERWATIGKHGALTPDQAREIARRWAAHVAAGGDPAEERQAARAAPTVSELLDRYLSEHVDLHNKASTAAAVREHIKVIRPALGRLKVAEVRRADIQRLHASMAATPYAANRALALLSKAFSLAEIWGLRPQNTNPCQKIKRYAEEARKRYLSQQEFAALGATLTAALDGPLSINGEPRPVHINPQAIHALRLLILTGARRGEILGLRWEWIDWNSGRAALPDSKTGAKFLHLSPPAIEVLRGLDRPASRKGFVIRGGRDGDPEVPLVNLKDPWRHLRAAAGLDDVRIHDLRHSFASLAVSAGMSLPMIGALLGHRNTRTTERYAHLQDEPLAAAAAEIGASIEGAMRPQRRL